MTPCPPYLRAETRPQVPAPAWADPRALMLATAVRRTPFETVMGVPVVIAPADPKRVAIGLLRRTTENYEMVLNPGGDVTAYAWTIGPAPGPVWFDLFTFGALVCEQWNATSGAQALFEVVEIYRLQ